MIVVKIECLAPEGQEIQEGYVELYKYNRDAGESDKVGERQVISPFPLLISVTDALSVPISTASKLLKTVH